MTLSMVTFILIFHFYLSRHYSDISETMKDLQSQYIRDYEIGIQDPNAKDTPKTFNAHTIQKEPLANQSNSLSSLLLED